MINIYKHIADNISEYPGAWGYYDFCLNRTFGGVSIKIRFFCERPYRIYVDKAEIIPTFYGKFLLKKAGKIWMNNYYKRVKLALDQDGMPIKEWMDKRNKDVEENS